MIRKGIMVAALALPAGLFAQNQPMSPNQTSPQTSTVVVPSTNIYVVGGGPYGGGVYVANGLSAAPESSPGISLADRAGIRLNQPSDLGVQSTLTPSPGGGYPVGAPAVVENSGASHDLGLSYFGGSAQNSSVAPISVGEIAALYRDNRRKNVRTPTNTRSPGIAESLEPCDELGLSYVEDSAPSESGPSTSLGEIARQYRAHRPKSVRTYTNADALRLSAGW